ncbi:unnamed protein product [Protopolystoma xenopodis]|uniref:Uncharacterized protein n=1 Tax=Protopolystoma xenopodis TaxID=117903 RepID=A0A3S5CVR4_9PLAT|nr:unnamed protein product [Protopolystoma xenopodis]
MNECRACLKANMISSDTTWTARIMRLTSVPEKKRTITLNFIAGVAKDTNARDDSTFSLLMILFYIDTDLVVLVTSVGLNKTRQIGH